MKNFLLNFLLIFSSLILNAQEKSVVNLGVDYIFFTPPASWSKDGPIESKKNMGTLNHIGFNAGYYYRNFVSIRLSFSRLVQTAHINIQSPPMKPFIGDREAKFYDCMLGVNMRRLLLTNSGSLRFLKKIDIWTMLGISVVGKNSYEQEYKYNPNGGFETWIPGNSSDFSGSVRPVGLVMVNVNLVKHLLIGAGTSYRFISANFQPVSFNLTLGLRL